MLMYYTTPRHPSQYVVLIVVYHTVTATLLWITCGQVQQNSHLNVGQVAALPFVETHGFSYAQPNSERFLCNCNITLKCSSRLSSLLISEITLRNCLYASFLVSPRRNERLNILFIFKQYPFPHTSFHAGISIFWLQT